MITLFDTAKEDFKEDRKGLKVLESLCELLGDLEVAGLVQNENDDRSVYIMKAIQKHISKTQDFEFVRVLPYEYKMYYKNKAYYVDVLAGKVKPRAY